MSKAYIRVWRQEDVALIKQHLLVVGDVSGDCANCKHIGIDYRTSQTCPNCKTEFKYIASRSNVTDYGGIVHKIKNARPELVFIDFNDFKRMSEKNKAREFFK